MLRPAFPAVTLLLAGGLAAQNDPAALQARLDDKLAADFLKQAAWTVDYDQARAQAKAQGKVVFAYFTRSYSP